MLLFDNSTMSFADQDQAREAAAKFVEANAGPDRYMAIMNFGGTLRVALNFTADAERLKQVVRNVKFSSVSPNARRWKLRRWARRNWEMPKQILARAPCFWHCAVSARAWLRCPDERAWSC